MRLLPTLICDTNGLRVSADEASGYVVFCAPANGAHLGAEDSLGVALALVQLHAPALYEAMKRETRKPALRVVHGGIGPEGDAA